MRLPVVPGLILAVAAGTTGADDVLLFSAASLTDAVGEAARACEAELGDAPVIHAAGTGVLAKQIRVGAPADVLFAANLEAFGPLVEAGRVRQRQVQPLLSNRLVVVVPSDSRLRLAEVDDLARLERLSVADTEAVPAGIYARHFLERAGLWEALSPRLVPALHVRAALAAVETGLVPAGIVYETDARSSARVRVAFAAAPGLSPTIRYALAPIVGSAVGQRWARCLASEAAVAIYARHGFLPLGEDAAP